MLNYNILHKTTPNSYSTIILIMANSNINNQFVYSLLFTHSTSVFYLTGKNVQEKIN